MDKTSIKNFAVNARKKLKVQIEQKAYALGITMGEPKKPSIHEDTFEVNGNKYEKRVLKHRDSLISKINEKGYEQVIEEVAYTWFNRFIAIRFMEVNEYLPTGVRVLSSTDTNKVEPDVIREVLNIDLDLNQDLVYKLQDENKTEELFKYILIKQCNELGKIMPVVFEEIEDYTELLLPDNLLQEGSIIRDLVTSIEEDDWKEQVEIIGWLYQYYISEKKDEVFEGLKKNIKITKENIPAATQLFTPDWIVKYMVENSLGRLWLESHPDEELKSKWKYYLEDAEQETDVVQRLQVVREKNKDLKPEEIKFLDPAMGSGHILVYAFDVLYDIYKSSGYSEREIPKFILENNLYGLDIDDRAAQLAYFAVMMKARSYNRRIFRDRLELNLCAIQESNGIPKEAVEYLVNPRETELEKSVHREDVEYLINIFNDAKEYGAILQVKDTYYENIWKRIKEIKQGNALDIFELQYNLILLEKIPILLKQAQIMSQKYDVVCTNPPYLGRKGMNAKLVSLLEKNFNNSKSDLYAVFLERASSYIKNDKFIAMITQHSWMFISSFNELRQNILKNTQIQSMVHLGTRAFEEISGEVVQTTTFILRNLHLSNYKPSFLRLVDISDASLKKENFSNKELKYHYMRQEEFFDIPNCPLAYWLSKSIRNTFGSEKLESLAITDGQTKTGNNDKYLRFIWEVDKQKVGKGEKWVIHEKAGTNRKWACEKNILIDWSDDARSHYRKDKVARIAPEYIWFRLGISWNLITTKNNFPVRLLEEDSTFNLAAPSIFMKEIENTYYILGLLNTKIANVIIKSFNPTINTNISDVLNIPVIFGEKSIRNKIELLVKECMEINKDDVASHETSFDFKNHPLLKHMGNEAKSLIEKSFENWHSHVDKQINMLQANEQELNKLFIDIYNLQDELTPSVNKDEVTVNLVKVNEGIKSFISYAVGCIFGRYSLDEEGLIYAGGQFNSDKYKTFKVDNDNVLPVLDNEYFEDDIVSRFIEFVKITFGAETIEENLDFIAVTLGKKDNETSRQTIRKYFLKDFYKDHLQTYQKKPIYWLLDSGKNDGFKALIYMHRYDIGNMARVRTDYLHLLQRKYEAEVNRLDMVIESNASTREKNEARKKKEKIQKQIEECKQYDQVIAHVANQKISIDLDDGVSVNYAKFQGIEVPQGEGRKPLKADLLAKI